MDVLRKEHGNRTEASIRRNQLGAAPCSRSDLYMKQSRFGNTERIAKNTPPNSQKESLRACLIPLCNSPWASYNSV